MPRTAILLSRAYGPDVRAEKEAHTLAAVGWRVRILAWDREGAYPAHARADIPPVLAAALADWPDHAPAHSRDPGVVTVTHCAIPAGYRTGRRLLRRMPRYWAWAWHELRRLRPDVVHAHDLDTLPVAVLYGCWAGVPVLYDAREYYPGMVRASVGAGISAALDGLERVLIPAVSGVITVGERLAAHYRALGARVTVVHNAQPLPDRAALNAQGRAVRDRLGVPGDALLVVYVGNLNPDRLLAPMLEAVPEIENVWFAVGGTGPQLGAVQDAAGRCARIRALGWVPLTDVPALVAAGDAVYYGLDANNPNSRYFMPNLAFFALAAGRPILTTPTGEIADFVARERCGIVLDAPTGAAAGAALRQLCADAYRATVTDIAQTLGLTRYRWLHAAGQLLAAYSECQELSENLRI